MTVNRRFLIGAGLTGLTSGLWMPAAFAASALPAPAVIADRARALSLRYGKHVRHQDYAAIVDYNVPSWLPRFHLVDLKAGKVASYLVAHGRGSDPQHTGWLQSFSNAVGSKASSKGAYVTVERYDGKYGRSIRLDGLDAQNSNAMKRAIVIHPAWYVGDEMIEKYGKLGRSEGCFAMTEADIAVILEKLGPGRLIYAAKI